MHTNVISYPQILFVPPLKKNPWPLPKCGWQRTCSKTIAFSRALSLVRLLGYFMAYSSRTMMLTTVMTQVHQGFTSPVHSTTKVYIKVC